MRTMTYYYDFEDEEGISGRQASLNSFLKMPKLRKIQEDDTFLEEWLEPNRYADA